MAAVDHACYEALRPSVLKSLLCIAASTMADRCPWRGGAFGRRRQPHHHGTEHDKDHTPSEWMMPIRHLRHSAIRITSIP